MAAENTQQRCRHARKCTGCTALSHPYSQQLAKKKVYVGEALKPVLASSRATLHDVQASPKPLGYRASVKICLHEDSLGRRAIGLYKHRTKMVVPIPGCPAHTAEVNRLLDRLFGVMGKVPARFYNHKGRSFQKGRLKFITIRSFGRDLKEQGIVLSHTGVPAEALKSWLHDLGLKGLCAWHSQLDRGDGDDIIGRKVAHLSGNETMHAELAGTSYELNPLAFFQANYSLSHELITATSNFGDGARHTLLDLYGGFGAYSLPLAKTFKELILVDANSHAIAAAEAMRSAAGLKHVRTHASLCEPLLKRLPPSSARSITHIIVNPPRSGLSRAVSAFLHAQNLPELKVLHYVSCNPETLGRDLQILNTQGLRLVWVKPFDMFPQTEHVEVLARLERA